MGPGACGALKPGFLYRPRTVHPPPPTHLASCTRGAPLTRILRPRRNAGMLPSLCCALARSLAATAPQPCYRNPRQRNTTNDPTPARTLRSLCSPSATPTPRCSTPRPSTPSPTCRFSLPSASSSRTVGCVKTQTMADSTHACRVAVQQRTFLCPLQIHAAAFKTELCHQVPQTVTRSRPHVPHTPCARSFRTRVPP